MSNQMVATAVSATDVILEDCKSDIQREVALIDDGNKTEQDIDRKLLGSSPLRESERLAIQTLLEQSSSKIVERFEQLGRVKDIMTENLQLENIIFDVCKKLGIEIPVEVSYSTESGEEQVDTLKFEGDYAKGAYTVKQLGIGAMYAYIKMDKEHKDNVLLQAKIGMLEEKLKLQEKKNEELESRVSEAKSSIDCLSSRPNVSIMETLGWVLYNSDTGRYVKAQDTEDVKTASPSDFKHATKFSSQELALAFQEDMVSYRNSLKKKFGSDYLKHSKMHVRNPQKYVALSVAVLSKGV
jgi:hypothetical protein